MLLLIIILILLFGGGGGYYGYSRWGAGGGLGILGTVLLIVLVPYLLDAIRAYEEGVGSIEDIDNAMKLGCGYPMGPFTLLDFVGLDTTYYITHVMYDEFKERRFASPPLLKRLVMAGWYGRKSGKGFYDYADPEKPKANKL